MPERPQTLRKPTFRDRALSIFLAHAAACNPGRAGSGCESAGQVLLLRHTYTPGWHFPGGGVERGETCGLSLSVN